MNLGMYALEHLKGCDLFAGIASDGLDNSDCAGVIIDAHTVELVKETNLDIQKYKEDFDGYTLFEQTGHEMIFTGPTQENVSDLMFWYCPKTNKDCDV